MVMPRVLQQFIEDGLNITRQGNCTDRAPDFASQIGIAIGPLTDSAWILDQAHRRRIALLLLTIRYVLPIWEREFPSNRSPHQFLNAVDQLLMGGIELEATTDIGYELVDWIDKNSLVHQGTTALNVAFSVYALLKALETVGGLRGVSPPYSAETEANVTISFAAQAYALDATVEPSDEATRWCRFWEWWLTEAVPSAWNVEL